MSCTRSYISMYNYINLELLVGIAAHPLGLLELLVDDHETVEAEVEWVDWVLHPTIAHQLL